jgi:hypothetical protein
MVLVQIPHVKDSGDASDKSADVGELDDEF